MIPHQFIDRRDQRPVDERFCGDPLVSLLYSRVRENSTWLYRMLTSARLTRLLALLRFDLRPPNPAVMRRRMTRQLGIDLTECVAPPETIDTPRKVFERQIRYWDCRPMDADPHAVVSPADARLLVGSLRQTSALFLKDKFFDCDELFGLGKTGWREAFRNGDYAVLRLTPEKYHYLHLPVTGMVRDIYEIDGVFQSCHPAVGIPAASVFNRLVEGHWHGFTVGGAAFIGITAGPWMLWALACFTQAEAQATLFLLSALAPAYGLGEGIGRLGCLSYGCCYGRRLADCSPWLRALFSHWHFSFAGPLKKACYERGFQEERLIPIQGITAIVSSAAGLLGVALFLQGRFVAAYALPIGATQVWRFASEFLRADYRGQGRISVYQWLALTAAASVVPVAFWWPDVPTSLPDVGAGVKQLWTPGALLLIQTAGAAAFLRLGISTVTASRLIFELAKQPSLTDALSPRHLVQPASERNLTLHAADWSHLGQAPHAPPPAPCLSAVSQTTNP